MSKVSKKLSPAVVDSAKPEADPYRVWDTSVPQLFLRVQPSGIKSFNVQWSRTRSLSLGKWPATTIDGARTRARAALGEVEKHGAPLKVLEASKPGAKFGTLGQYIEREYRPWARMNRKAGDSTVKRIQASFAELMDKPMTGLNAWLIDKWRMGRVKAGRKAATINRDLIALRAALNMAVTWKMLDTNPIADAKLSKVEHDERVRFLSEDEEQALRAALTERDEEGRAARARTNQWRAERGHELMPEIADDGFYDHLTPFVLVSMNCGTRRGELTGLTWDAVDFNRRILTVRAATSKGAKTRHVPLNDEALDVLTRWRRQCSGSRVFAFKSIKTAWAALMKKAGIRDLRPHDLRHHFASRLVQADVSLYHVQKLLGHGSLRMTERYSHVKESDLAAAVAKLGVA